MAGPLFQGQQRAFQLKAAAVADQSAVAPDNAVAGDDEADGVGADGAPDGAHGARTFDLRGDVAVGARLAVGDGEQGLPDGALKGGAAQVQRKGERRVFAGAVGLQVGACRVQDGGAAGGNACDAIALEVTADGLVPAREGYGAQALLRGVQGERPEGRWHGRADAVHQRPPCVVMSRADQDGLVATRSFIISWIGCLARGARFVGDLCGFFLMCAKIKVLCMYRRQFFHQGIL